MDRMSGLAGLVERGLVAPDWARALAPVEEQIEAMGRFLRAELAAGRGYLPAGERVLRAFQRPLADVRVLVVGQDPYPTPGHPIGLSFAVDAHVRPVPRSLANIYRELADDVGVVAPRARRPDRVGGPGRDAAQPGAHGAPRGGRVAPRPGLGGRHAVRDRGARAPRWAAGRGAVGPGRAGAGARCWARCRRWRRRTPRR